MTNDELKQPTEAAEETASVTETAPKSERAPSQKEASSETAKSKNGSKPKATGAKKSGNSGSGADTKASADGDVVRASTAERADHKPKDTKTPSAGNSDKKKNADNSKKEKEAPDRMPSTKRSNRMLQGVLYGVAIFMAVCVLINLIFHFGNPHADNPIDHPLGSVGYWLSYVLFGLFGAAMFILPVMILNMAIFWKAYVDNKLVLEKVFVSLLLLVSIGTLFHSFSFFALPDTAWERTAKGLMAQGAEMRYGGLLGGGLGNFLVRYMNKLGTLFMSLLLTAISGFFFLGMTPQFVFEKLRAKYLIRRAIKEKEKSVRRAIAEEQAERAAAEAPQKHREKHRPAPRHAEKTADTQEAENDPDDGLAPMPMPILDASDETPVSNLYVPADIGREMRQGNAARRPAPSGMQQPPRPRPAEQTGNRPSTPPTGRPMDPSDRQRTQAKPPMPPHPDTFRSPEPPRDSMEAVFPRSAAEVKTARRAQKNDVNFELGSIFVDLDDHKPQAQKTHRPLPPEVPLPVSGGRGGQRPAANRPQGAPPSNGQRPAPSGTGRPTGSSSDPMRNGARPTAARPNGVSGQGSTISVRPATAPAGVNPANRERTQGQKGNKTVFVPLEKDKNQEFGLSNEEFEQREASVQTLSRAAGTRSAEKKPSNNGNGKAAPQKDEKAKAAKTSSDASAATASAEKPYIFPPISYLHPSEPMTAENESEIEANRNKLAATLEDFNVRDTRIAYSCGPTVTRYEIYPPSGVRVRTITNLADDIALSFAVSSVRMEAIPGKSAIGVEVPNITRQTVYLRDLLESQAFVEKPSRLTAGLGADVAGTPLLFDIAKMPHLLVAGATGMGKSVCINCIIMSILFKARPDEVKLVLIDPKKVEFSLYKGIPHLMAPVIVTPKDAAGALQAAVLEMEDRFTKIQDVGVNNIEGYNKAAAKDPDLPPMPQIVIIIDELADLMLTARDEVEDSICRLAQKARAAGMHIIVGTQRPSVDVVTGLIKSNIPSRIACTVASQVDSRTILDIAGAEKLLGKGDMLFAPVGAMKPTRVQGAFVADAEVEKICEFIRATNGTAVYDEGFTSKMKEYSAMCGNKKNKNGEAAGGAQLPGESGDNKYVDAIRVSIEENRVSTSLLQRKLGIGYSRAAKIIDRMEEEGLVSKADGAKPRNILISAEQFIERYVEGDAGADVPDDI